MKRAAQPRRTTVCMNIFHRLKSALAFRRSQHFSSNDSCLSLFLIQRDMLDANVLQHVRNQIQQWTMLGWKVAVTEAELHIPDGYIGLHLHFDEGQLKYQEYLRIEVECVERKILVFQRISQQVLTIL